MPEPVASGEVEQAPRARADLGGALFERHFSLPWPAPATQAALLGFLLLTAFLYREALFEGRVIFRRDISMVWLPQVEALVRAVSAGSWPLWDPFSGFGRPLLADPRAQVFYPLTWLNFLLAPALFYTLFAVLHMLIAGWGVFALARRWGTSWGGAFCAGALFIASGPFLSLTLMWHHMAGAAWIPWVALTLDRALDARRAREALACGATLALQVFAGSPDLTALMLVALGLYVLARRGSWRASASEGRAGRTRTALLSLVFGLLLCAPQWLPTLEWSLRSERTRLDYERATSWSQHPLALVEVLLPLGFDRVPLKPEVSRELLQAREPWLHSIHLGPAALALVLLGALTRGPRRLTLALLLLLSLAFALGRHAPFHAAVVALVPPLGMLRFPVKALVLAGLAWSLLAGFGLDALLGRARSRGRNAGVVVVGALAGAALVGLWAVTLGADALGARWLVLAGGPTFAHDLAPLALAFALSAAAALGLLLLALRCRARRPPMAALLAVGLALASPLARHARLNWTAPAELWSARPRVLGYLGQRPLTRLYVYDYTILTGPQLASNPGAERAYTLARLPRGWEPALGVFFGVQLYLNPPTAARWGFFGSFDRDILGFDPEPLARLNEFLREREDSPAHLRLLRLAAVDYVMALVPAAWWRDLEPLGSVEEVFQHPLRVFRVPRTLPRAFVVGGARVRDGEAARDALASPDFDPEREVVLAAGTPRAAPLRAPGSCRIVAWRPDRVSLVAELEQPGFLVLADAWDPGWRATVDGREVAVQRANVAFRALELPAGRHAVEFVYRPRAALLGFALAGLALGTALVAWLRARQRARGAARA